MCERAVVNMAPYIMHDDLKMYNLNLEILNAPKIVLGNRYL